MSHHVADLVMRASACLEAARFGRISASTAREYRNVADRIQAARLEAGPDWQGPKSIARSTAYATVCRAAWARRSHLEVAKALRDLRDQAASDADIEARLATWVPEAEACPPVAFRFDPAVLARRVGRPNKIEQPKKSKRFGMRELPAGWMDRLWCEAAESQGRHLDTLAVTLATGCRPVELVHGVNIRRVPGGLEATVAGAKVTGFAGQPWRRLTIAEDRGGPVAHLIALADAAGGEVTVRMVATPAAFSMFVTALGERLGLERRVSPYDVRHRRAADARLAFGHDLQRVAAWLGHSGEETVRFYGRAGAGGGIAGAQPVDAVAAKAVRHRERATARPAPGTAT